jgi:tetratricopeptide (TPR) repeat protein
MKRIARFPVFAVAVLSLLTFMTGCNRLQARDQLNKGVSAYKNAKYEEAIGHFQKAVQLDPTLPMAKLYLATAYAQQVVPDLETSENLQSAQMAIDGFKDVLAKEPKDLTALKGIASLYFNTKKYDDARDWQKKVIAVDPIDPEAHYSIGVIDWRLAYRNAVKTLTAAGMQDDGNGNVKMPKAACASIQQQNTPLVTEGIEYLQKAIDLRPAYDEAMSYINLVYRRKADLECGNDAARKADLAQADAWRDKSMGTRKANEEKKNEATPGGITMEDKK